MKKMNALTSLSRRVLYAMLAAQRFPWEQGVAAQAAYECGLDEIWLPMAHDTVRRALPDGRLAMAGTDIPSADPAAAGEVCLRAWQKTGDLYFRAGADGMLEYLLHRAPRTADGLICHNTVSFHDGFSSRQLWVDALYMVPPFLAVMGEFDEANRQINGYIRHLLDPEKMLFRHIYDAGEGCFVRDVFWATGNGWALMGLCRVACEAADRSRHDISVPLFDLLRRLISAMSAYQEEDGRFRDILGDPSSFPESTSGLMFAYTVYRCVRRGELDPSFRDTADRAVRAAEEHIDGMGVLREVCGCPDFLRPGTSVEAQAAYLLAVSQRDG